MNILFLSPSFPQVESDSAVLTYFTNYLDELRKDPQLSLTIIAVHYPFQAGVYKWKDVEVHSIGGRNCGFPKSVLYWWTAFQTVSRLHRNSKFDLIHSLWIKECGFFGSLISRVLDIPHLITAMGTETLRGNRWMIGRRLFTGRLVYVSQFQRMHMHYKLRMPSDVISWGLGPRNTVLGREERDVDLVFVGNLSDVKQVESFILIVEDLVKSFDASLTAYIIGEDYSSGRWKMMIEELGIQSHICLMGQQENSMVLELLARSKTLVHPSLFESQGYVFLEALAQGVNIVSRSVGIARIQPGWWIADTFEEFIAAIKASLADSSTRQRRFPIPIGQTVDQYCALYRHMSVNRYSAHDHI